MPVAVVVEGAGVLQDAVQFHAAGPHKVDVSLRRGVAVLEGAFFLCLAPEDLIVAVRVERRVDINQVNALVREFLELFEIVAAVNHPRIDKSRWPALSNVEGFPRRYL